MKEFPSSIRLGNVEWSDSSLRGCCSDTSNSPQFPGPFRYTRLVVAGRLQVARNNTDSNMNKDSNMDNKTARLMPM
jgi:hypothetical protein